MQTRPRWCDHKSCPIFGKVGTPNIKVYWGAPPCEDHFCGKISYVRGARGDLFVLWTAVYREDDVRLILGTRLPAFDSPTPDGAAPRYKTRSIGPNCDARPTRFGSLAHTPSHT